MVINKEQFNSLPTNLQVCFRKKQDNLNGGAYSGGERSDGDWKDNSGFKNDKLDEYQQPLGRFPANLIHDNSQEVRECFPDSKSGGAIKEHKRDTSNINFADHHQEWEGFNDSGNASRFFKSIIYQAKASRSERNKGCEGLETSEKFTAGNYSQSPTCKTCDLTLNGTNDHSECSGEVYYKEMESKNTKNNHPTVKPIALMEYLIKMVTKPGGIVLDPFAGSGSTLVASKQNGFQYVGIERESEYIKIIQARLDMLQ